MTVATLNLNWLDPGPISAAFRKSRAPVCGIIGPVGSAKTSTCFRKLVENGLFIQEPHPVDGWVRVKYLTVRETYRELEKTTIPTWQRWFPPAIGEFTGGTGGRPAQHSMRFDLQGRRIDMTMEFAGIGEQSAEDFARGLERTGIYMNEADRMSRAVFTQLRGRMGKGRFPPADAAVGFRGCTLPQLIFDCNAPNVEDWIYQDFIENEMKGAEVFIQPSGLSAEAENLANLNGGREYYEALIVGQPDYWVRRMVGNEFGYSRAGEPVFPEFVDRRHVAPSIMKPAKELPLVIGADAGLTPAAVFCQQMPTGQWRIYDEIVRFNMGAPRFADAINRLLDGPESPYRGIGKVAMYVDPSANAKSETDERQWADIIREKTGLPVKAAPTNKPSVRLTGVRSALMREVDADTPGLLINPTCRVLRKGFNGAYRYKVEERAGGMYRAEVPDKGDESHVHDALQYALLGGGEYAEVTGRARRRRERIERERAAGPQPAYDPFAW